jgi:hypothetical protein
MQRPDVPAPHNIRRIFRQKDDPVADHIRASTPCHISGARSGSPPRLPRSQSAPSSRRGKSRPRASDHPHTRQSPDNTGTRSTASTIRTTTCNPNDASATGRKASRRAAYQIRLGSAYWTRSTEQMRSFLPTTRRRPLHHVGAAEGPASPKRNAGYATIGLKPTAPRNCARPWWANPPHGFHHKDRADPAGPAGSLPPGHTTPS